MMRIRHFFGVPVVLLGSILIASAAAADWFHPPIQIKKNVIRVGTGENVEVIEDVSSHCLECHGPDMGAGEAGAEAPIPTHSVGGSGRSHPVNVAYPETKGGLASRAALDERLALIQGQMTCITCHDPEASDHALVLPKDGSQLCLACHQR